MQSKKFTCDYKMNASYMKEILTGQSDAHRMRTTVLALFCMAFSIYGYLHGLSLITSILWMLIGVFMIIGAYFSAEARKASVVLKEYKVSSGECNDSISITVDKKISWTEKGTRHSFRFRDITGVRDADRFILLYFGENREICAPILKRAILGGSIKECKQWIQRQIQVKA